MIFANPIVLSALLIIPFIAFLIIRHPSSGEPGAVHYSDTRILAAVKPGLRVRLANGLPWLSLAALVLMLIALARPQLGLEQSRIRRAGVDVILAIDLSSSMGALDFSLSGKQASRLDAVKIVAKKFIQNRPNDRIGIVVFSGHPYILAPLSWDHDWAVSRLSELKPGAVEESGTAIGAALATSVNRLQDSAAKSRVIILLTDGMNNSGLIPPEAAAASAKKAGISVYTIGAGSRGVAPVPVIDTAGNVSYENQTVNIDEALLTRIAESTGGRYFRATDTRTLSVIFERINRMAKTSMEAPLYNEYLELYPYFLAAALLLLCVEMLLANTVFRRLP